LGKPEADRFIELRPFYQLCGLGLLLTALNFALGLWLMGGAVLAGVYAIGALAVAGWWQRKQRRELEQRLARASASERPRLKSRLDALRTRLRQFSGDEAAQLVLVPDPAVVLATVRSRRAPLVEMTAGFWTTYSDAPEVVEAALAHEAGHVAARDVELFQNMLGMMRGLMYAFPLLNVLLPLVGMALTLRNQGDSWYSLLVLDGGSLLQIGRQWLSLGLTFTIPMAAGPALAVAFAWSALLVARELQADAFAVAVLGSEHPVRALLQSQLQRRQQQAPQRSPLRRLATWLIQPDLRWRSTLPALQGQLGPRVELLLGLASGGFLLSSVGTALFVALHRGAKGQEVLVLLVSLGVWVWLSWISYALFWGRSRTQADGSPRNLLSGLGSVVRFSLAQLSVLALWMLMPWGENGQNNWRYTGPWVLTVLLATAFALWAAGKLALCSAAERQRRSPRLRWGLVGLLAVGVVSLALRAGFGLLRDAALPPGHVSNMAGPAVTLVASLLVGTLAHLLTRPARASAGGPR
jgi:Zn-dependent protease with chaperone function